VDVVAATGVLATAGVDALVAADVGVAAAAGWVGGVSAFPPWTTPGVTVAIEILPAPGSGALPASAPEPQAIRTAERAAIRLRASSVLPARASFGSKAGAPLRFYSPIIGPLRL
jgi:hypothetical protein